MTVRPHADMARYLLTYVMKVPPNCQQAIASEIAMVTSSAFKERNAHTSLVVCMGIAFQ